MTISIRPYRSADHDACASIFAGLEPWFGIPEAVTSYLEALGQLPSKVATIEDTVVGFMALEIHSQHAAEIHVMAVAGEKRGQGVGRRLVKSAEQFCRSRDIEFLQIKTLDPARESPEYAETRGFYEGMGFVHLQTFPELWDPSNPARQLVKRVPPHTVESLVDKLGLEPHPEGGYYRETWRSHRELQLPEYDGPRNAGTAILFLLPSGQRSAWHKVASDELWIWQDGDPLELRTVAAIDKSGQATDEDIHVLGDGHHFQAVVPGQFWQTATPLPGHAGYSLCTCVVVPGFDFQDFEMTTQELT